MVNAKPHVCAECGETYHSCGRTTRCSACWPMYRQAYNLVAIARYRAVKSRIAFDIDIPWVQGRLRQPCPRTGLHFTVLARSRNMTDRPYNSPSLDKIDPFGGYTKDNVQVVAWWYNCAKQRYSDSEVLELCNRVVQTASS